MKKIFLNFILIIFLNYITNIEGNNLQCQNNTCCFISNIENCSFDYIKNINKPILIFPGDNTRCIKSTSTPYGII